MSKNVESLANKKEEEHNDFEVYTSTDDFIQKVMPIDRSLFSRSLANKTSGMKKGETREFAIYGATRNGENHVYYFEANGYMCGSIVRTALIDENSEIIWEEYRNGIDGDTKIADLWVDSFSAVEGRSKSNFLSHGNTRRTAFDDSISTKSSKRNGTTNHARGGANYQSNPKEVENVLRKLKELYGNTALKADDNIRYALPPTPEKITLPKGGFQRLCCALKGHIQNTRARVSGK